MIVATSIGFLSFTIGSGITYFWIRSNSVKKFAYLELEVKARAKAIELESERMLQNSTVQIKKNELEQEKIFQDRLSEIEKRNRNFILETKILKEEKSKLKKIQQRVEDKSHILEQLKIKKEREINEIILKMESVASMTQDEAKTAILEKVEEKSQSEIAGIVRKYEQKAKEDGEKRANYILAQATTRYAGEFAGERLINLITLPSDEHKGRIIGKEGRNIKTLEMLLGVDIIIDETPGTILVSSFNLYRRAIATRVIELLVEDGRIHPGRIEEIHKKVESNFENKIYEEGENIIIDMGLFPMHEDLIRLIGKLKYRASYGQNALAHTLEVAKLASVMAGEMGGDEKLAMRAGLLHDIGKALTQEMGGSHVDLGADLCRKYNEHPSVINAIYAHHGHEEPDSVESASVCAADALSAARPGARREVLESFTKRVKDLEDIALDYDGVERAYAINAGREIRVYINAGVVNDNEAVLMSRNIAKNIEDRVQYPGEIKVTVIREARSINYAR